MKGEETFQIRLSVGLLVEELSDRVDQGEDGVISKLRFWP